ncbi:MAG: 5'-methylthioadenosine/S-adenosylhomocysteine nucleosidase [Lachnospiraceae bacterium]|nr:5'-methylthioadenosine/S-adenosylhomocysteine nucleosidase [Lachnospiraceae bacterium]
MKKVLLQGAMDIETNYLTEQVTKMENYQCHQENDMVFHIGTDGNKTYIVNQTGMGTVKAAMATAYALSAFHPTLVVNQGTAGAQSKELSTGDVVLVQEAVNINALSMPKKKMGEGSDPFYWEGFHTTYYQADEILLDLYSKPVYTTGRMVRGNAATGDIYSREDDRIVWLAEKFRTICEDMETAAVYEVCEKFQTPCIGLRIISNNELLDEEFNTESAELLQHFVWEVTHDYL